MVLSLDKAALFFLAFLLCSNTNTSSQSSFAAAATHGDCAALLQLKSSITKDPTGFLTSWNTTNLNCCRGWNGVKCQGSRVIELQLSNGELSGALHRSVGSLSSLQKLDLSNNHLTGTIPSSITKLSQLQLLDLAYNYGIEGSIPSSIGDLKSLVRLRLQSNKLTGEVPASFGKLSSLVYAELDDNLLTGPVPDSFTRHLSQLALLDLAKNKLTGLPQNLSGLARLGILYLSSNPLTYDSIRGVSTLPFLGELHAASAGLKGPIPRWLATINLRQSDDFLTSLLDLSGNEITGSVPAEISQISNLERLVLSGNKLTGRIPASVGSLGSLRGLLLNDNHLNGGIPTEFGRLEILQQLQLENNQLNGAIPESLTQLTLLRWFNVSNNRLSGQIPQGGAFSTFDATSFAGNPGLCGKPLRPC